MQRYTFFSNKLYTLTGKLSRCFLLLALLFVSSQVHSQGNKLVAIGAESNTIGLAIKAIEAQTGYRVSYDSKLDMDRRIILPSAPTPLSSILPLILKDTGYSYTIVNELIGIRYDGSSGRRVDAAVIPTKQVERQGSDLLVSSSVSETLVEREEAVSNSSVVSLPGTPAANGLPLLTPIDDMRFNKTIVDHLPPISTPITNPKVALKTNLLLAATTSLNIAIEVRLSDRLTLDVPVSYNPWEFSDNKLFRHLLVQPELRFWPRGAFNGHFFGANLLYSFVNMGNIKAPFGLWSDLKDYRFEGNVFGAGVSYGYQWMLSNRFSMEATVGVGYAYADYDKFPCVECGKLIEHDSKHYFGPTKLGVSLIYFIK